MIKFYPEYIFSFYTLANTVPNYHIEGGFFTNEEVNQDSRGAHTGGHHLAKDFGPDLASPRVRVSVSFLSRACVLFGLVGSF